MLLYGGSKQCFKKVVFIMARKSTVIDQVVFTSSVKEAEKNGALKNLGELYTAIARIYTLAVIALGSTVYCTPALAKKFIEEWGIETLTEPGRKGRPAKKDDFLVKKLEEAQNLCAQLMNLIPVEMTELRTDFQFLQTFLSLQPGETIDEETGEVIKPVTENVSSDEITDETLEPIMPDEQRIAA